MSQVMQTPMPGYVIEIRRERLGPSENVEAVCVIANDQTAALKLVETGLRLDGTEDVRVTRALSDFEVRRLGLKPFQVKHI